MSSRVLSLADRISSLDESCEVLSNKETQTSTTYITDSIELVKGPSRPLPKGIDKSKVEGTVNILDCKIIKDPSLTKTISGKESFITDIENSDLSTYDGSPKLTYCKEVVVPYLNPHLRNCEDNIDSLEKLIQDALEDFPDYQPCFEIHEGKKDIQEKIINKNLIPNMDSRQETPVKSNLTTKECLKILKNQSAPTSTPHLSSTQLSQGIVKRACPDGIQKAPVVADETDINEETCRSLSKESIVKCVKNSFSALKRSASSCFDKIEVVIGIKRPENPDEKPKYYVIERPKAQCSTSHNIQTETGNSLKSIKNLLNDHNEKIATIKDSVKNFAGRCYKTSKDAVTLISSESAKLLSKGKTKVYGDDSENRSKDKNFRNNSSHSFANFLFKKAENKPVKEEPPKEKHTEPSGLNNTTSPTIKPPKIIEQIKNDILSSKFDKSSSYDNPTPNEISNQKSEIPETRIPTVSAVDHPPDPPSSTSNMFTMLKSKIFSIFQDESELVEPMIEETPQDDDEEDIFERFMEQ